MPKKSASSENTTMNVAARRGMPLAWSQSTALMVSAVPSIAMAIGTVISLKNRNSHRRPSPATARTISRQAH